MSTGGLAQPEWSPCRITIKILTKFPNTVKLLDKLLLHFFPFPKSVTVYGMTVVSWTGFSSDPNGAAMLIHRRPWMSCYWNVAMQFPRTSGPLFFSRKTRDWALFPESRSICVSLFKRARRCIKSSRPTQSKMSTGLCVLVFLVAMIVTASSQNEDEAAEEASQVKQYKLTILVNHFRVSHLLVHLG